MKLIDYSSILFVLLAAMLSNSVVAAELSDEEVKKLAANGKDDRTAILEELRVYPDAKQYKAVATTTEPGGKPTKHKPITVSEKWVDGKYIVSQFRLPAFDQDTVVVVTFNRDSRSYRRWAWTGEGAISTSMGIRVEGTRALAWFPIHEGQAKESDLASHSIEILTDTTVKWTAVTVKRDGTILLQVDGIAMKTK